MDQERENSATRYSGSHRESRDHGRGSRGASPDEIGQDARSTKKDPSEGDDEELGVDEERWTSTRRRKRRGVRRDAQGDARERRISPTRTPPRFDFHDFPRKTNQADVANAAVTAEVRESRRTHAAAIRAHAEVTASASAAGGGDKTSSKPAHALTGSAQTTQGEGRMSEAHKTDTTDKKTADKKTSVKVEDGFAVPPPPSSTVRGAGGLPVMPPPHAPQEPVRVSGHPRVFGAAHRSIFLAGGGVVGHNIPMRHVGKGPPPPRLPPAGTTRRRSSTTSEAGNRWSRCSARVRPRPPSRP